MKYTKQILRKRFFVYATAAVVTGGFMLVGSLQNGETHAASSDKMYLSPSSGTHTVGSTFSVAIRENSNTDQVNTVEADLTYPTSKLQYISTSLSGTAFGITAVKTGGSGSTSTQLGTMSSVTGDKLVATVTFKVLASGSGSVTFASSSQVLSSSTNSNVLGSMTGGSYTLQAASTGSSGSTSKPPASSGSGSSTKLTPSVTTSTPSSSSSTPTTSIAPKDNPKPVTVSGNSSIELNGQATVQTTPSSSSAKNVTKVEYYLNNKLVATVTKPPYNYSVNTEGLRNGNYTLTSKTYYKNGKIASKDTALVVKNPLDWAQLKLQLRHYVWVIIVAAIIIVDIVWTLLRRSEKKWLGSNHTNIPAPGPTAHVGIM
jgi:Bacterial Ig domain